MKTLSIAMFVVGFLAASGSLLKEDSVWRGVAEQVGKYSDSDYVIAKGFPSPVWIVSDPYGRRFDGSGPEGRLFVGNFATNWVIYCGLFALLSAPWFGIRALSHPGARRLKNPSSSARK